MIFGYKIKHFPQYIADESIVITLNIVNKNSI